MTDKYKYGSLNTKTGEIDFIFGSLAQVKICYFGKRKFETGELKLVKLKIEVVEEVKW